jgi:hypothetical protein
MQFGKDVASETQGMNTQALPTTFEGSTGKLIDLLGMTGNLTLLKLTLPSAKSFVVTNCSTAF